MGKPLYTICVLSFCCLSRSNGKTQTWCWLCKNPSTILYEHLVEINCSGVGQGLEIRQMRIWSKKGLIDIQLQQNHWQVVVFAPCLHKFLQSLLPHSFFYQLTRTSLALQPDLEEQAHEELTNHLSIHADSKPHSWGLVFWHHCLLHSFQTLLPTNKLIILHSAKSGCLHLSILNCLSQLHDHGKERKIHIRAFCLQTSFAKPKLQDWHIGPNLHNFAASIIAQWELAFG